ncbi:MarR family winged helix-turn-helix transcriptional regulator [Actinokineospora bangkokensis]|uniref:MarR family transcriptional regulator n=1 Tax=Actinokineospora bangkokensis TaxID=1193682 RepID=A0A1Q9LKB9_9PSEU|nr:MarR family winged helix-turn-helix transcriptional regulator [Actinokineospora bangkokensis]OLR92435.1 MarR family transcriptional regulator [Actinokineospora bangkokensis]
MHATPAVEADLGWALGSVFRAYLRASDAVLAGLPGGPRGYQVLATAERGEPLTQLAIAQRLGIDRTVMTYLIDDLERSGLVERRPDPADRRARLLSATAAGRARLAEATEALRQAEEHVLSPLTGAEREVLRDLLRKVAVVAAAPGENPCTIVQEVVGKDSSC